MSAIIYWGQNDLHAALQVRARRHVQSVGGRRHPTSPPPPTVWVHFLRRSMIAHHSYNTRQHVTPLVPIWILIRTHYWAAMASNRIGGSYIVYSVWSPMTKCIIMLVLWNWRFHITFPRNTGRCPMLGCRWPIIYDARPESAQHRANDAGPASAQHWANGSCLLGYYLTL